MSEEIRAVVEDVLQEQGLWNFTQLYGKEHNLLRGTHNLQYDNLMDLPADSWFDVRAGDAKFDGTTDDTSSIQPIIDAAHTAGGGTVLFPEGTTLVTGLVGYADVRIVGSGRASIIKRASGSAPLLRFTGTHASHLWGGGVSNLQFEGNNAAGDILDLQYCSRFIVDNVVIKEGTGKGIKLTECWDCYFDNVEIREIGDSSNASVYIYYGTGASNSLYFNNLRIENYNGKAIEIPAFATDYTKFIKFVNLKVHGYPTTVASRPELLVMDIAKVQFLSFANTEIWYGRTADLFDLTDSTDVWFSNASLYTAGTGDAVPYILNINGSCDRINLSNVSAAGSDNDTIYLNSSTCVLYFSNVEASVTRNAGAYIGTVNEAFVSHGSARVTKTVWVPASGVREPGTKPATWKEWGISGVWEFSDGTDDTIVANLQFPYDMDLTVAPSISIGVSAHTAVVTETSVWQLEYLYTAPGEDTTAAAQATITVNVDAAAQADGLVVATFPAMVVPGATDVCVHMRIKRLGADPADDLTDTAELHGLCMAYTSNKLGA